MATYHVFVYVVSRAGRYVDCSPNKKCWWTLRHQNFGSNQRNLFLEKLSDYYFPKNVSVQFNELHVKSNNINNNNNNNNANNNNK